MSVTIFSRADEIPEAEKWVENYSRDDYSVGTAEYVASENLDIHSLRRDFQFSDKKRFFLIKREWYFDYVAGDFWRRVAVNHVFRTGSVDKREGCAVDGEFETLESTCVFFSLESPRDLSMRLLGIVGESVRRSVSEFDAIVVPSVSHTRNKFFSICSSMFVTIYSYIVMDGDDATYFIPGRNEFASRGLDIDEDLAAQSYSYGFDIRLLIDYKRENCRKLFHMMFEHGIGGDDSIVFFGR